MPNLSCFFTYQRTKAEAGLPQRPHTQRKSKQCILWIPEQ